MNQIKIVSSRKKKFSATIEIICYRRKSMESLLVAKYRINGKYHRAKNE